MLYAVLVPLLVGTGINIVTAFAKPSENARRGWLALGWGCIGLAAIIALAVWSPVVLQSPFAWRATPRAESSPVIPTVKSMLSSSAVPAETPAAEPSPITSDREAGCEFVNVSPKFLVELLEEHTSVQGHRLLEGYIGKCLKFGGVVKNVAEYNDKTSVVTFSYYDPNSKGDLPFYAVDWWFDPDWADRTTALSKGTHIIVEGRIKSVDSLNVNLEHCKFLPSP
jgi:hypothetical protein